ncbi:MAG: tyrosine-protein phosphatase [Planctomycetota bacterium]
MHHPPSLSSRPHRSDAPLVRLHRGLLLAAACFLVPLTAGCRGHFYEVDEGRFFRSAQLAPSALERVIRSYGIRTVINLRGCKPEKLWYQDETRVCAELGVAHHDLDFSARRLPHKGDLCELLDLYRHAELPILVHCQGGSDRSGVASAIWAIEQMGRTNRRARRHLSSEFGHFQHLKPSNRYFLRMYEGREWAFEEYDPCSGDYEFYDVSRYCLADDWRPTDPEAEVAFEPEFPTQVEPTGGPVEESGPPPGED